MIVNKAYFYCPQCGKETINSPISANQPRYPLYDKRLDNPLYFVKCKCGNHLAGYTYINPLYKKETKRVIKDYNHEGYLYSEIIEQIMIKECEYETYTRAERA